MCKCTCETTAAPNYVGKLVFVEACRDGKDAKTYSNYYGGEYFIIRQSSYMLYGVKINNADEYCGRQIQQLPLVGDTRYLVLASSEANLADVREFVQQLWYNANRLTRGEKGRWTEGVYDEAKATAKQIARLVDVQLDAPTSCPPFAYETFHKRLTAVEQTITKLSGVFGK